MSDARTTAIDAMTEAIGDRYFNRTHPFARGCAITALDALCARPGLLAQLAKDTGALQRVHVIDTETYGLAVEVHREHGTTAHEADPATTQLYRVREDL